MRPALASVGAADRNGIDVLRLDIRREDQVKIVIVSHLRIESQELERMRARPGAIWVCHQDLDLHSSNFGKLIFELEGTPPPDHWGWTFMGFVDTEKGHIFEESR
jgi:hypothetical protein